MRIRQDDLKSVFFIGYQNQTDNKMIPIGSAVYLCEDDASQGYIVTAAHIIHKLKALGVKKVYVFVNFKPDKAPKPENQKAFLTTEISSWVMHPTDEAIDIAFFSFTLSHDADYLAIKFQNCMNDKLFVEHEVSIGDELIITGLFHHHAGQYRNIPIVRIGNLAALNEEKIMTKLGPMDAYLIEARSIGGLSGSPVYVNLGHTRFIKGKLTNSGNVDGVTSVLFGILHGHYDETFDSDNTTIESPEKINMGIAIVTPIQRAIELIKNSS